MSRTQKEDYRKQYLTPITTDYVVADVLIANGTLTIAAQPDTPRNLTVTVTDGDVSITAGTVTITGTSPTGLTQTDVLTLPTLTLTTTNVYASVTSVVVASLAGNGAGDNIKVGIGGTCQVKTGAGILKSVIVGTDAAGTIGIIDNTTGTTVNVLQLKSSIATGVYTFDCLFKLGLRIILGHASLKVSVMYS